jgi:hypothetical protein
MAFVGGLLGKLIKQVQSFAQPAVQAFDRVNRPFVYNPPTPQQQQNVQKFQAARTSPLYGPYAAPKPQVQGPVYGPPSPPSTNMYSTVRENAPQQTFPTYNPPQQPQQQTTDPGMMLTPEQQVDQSILQSVQSLQDESNRLFSEYNQKYPFIFDEVLKQKTKEAMQQQGIGPEAPETTFYNEKLSDYLLGVDRKKGRGVQSANQLLSELQRQTQSYSQDTQLRLQQALNRATSGFADIGLGSSGERYGAEGALKAGYQQNVEDFMGGQQLRAGQEQQSLDRYLTDLSVEKQGQVRDLYRQSGEATKTLAGQLTKEAGQKYTTGYQATLPPQYQGLQSNQSLDLLKSIGIYA